MVKQGLIYGVYSLEVQCYGEINMSLSAAVHASGSNKSQRQERKDLRLDIQGLRAVAVGVVLLYHAGFTWIPGGYVGVDVFFVISGFLISSGIVREINRTGRLSMIGFWGRRAARILPAATLTLIVVTVLSYLIMPITRWLQVGKDVIASGTYMINWVFADSSLDYLARDQAPSPFQHFWSLAVEEQFYLVWPLILVVAGWVAIRVGARRVVGFGIAVVVVGVSSLLWSVYLTATNPGPAYFATTTRMWELAIGAGLAIFAGLGSSIPKVPAAIIGWTGLGAIGAAAVIYTDAVPFPSFTAALPTIGAALVIWAGPMAGNIGPAALLSRRPMVDMGAVSYSLYLWHWPLLVLATALLGDLSTTSGLLVVIFSFVPAWISLQYVERPFLKWSKSAQGSAPALKAGGMLSLVTLTVGALLAVSVPPVPPASNIAFVPANPLQSNAIAATPMGAEVLLKDMNLGDPQDSFDSITPSALAAPTDVPQTCLQSSKSDDVVRCMFGDPESTTVLAVVGDSHAAMYVPGMAAAALEKGWRLDVYTKGSCPLAAVVVLGDGHPYDNCHSWGKAVSESILAGNPTALVVGSSRDYQVAGVEGRDASNAALAQGMRDAWSPFLDAGIPVVSVRDMPRPGVLVPDCVAENETSLTKCAMPRQDILAESTPEVEAVNGVDGAHLLDLTHVVCPGDMCPAVIGGVQIYRDGNHLTETYSRTMHAQFAEALDQILSS
ncbi:MULTISPECIES: acyltransferase family protein [unclassified Arthrobacter]|uniref:acyltransferase family protein n=1 Tax=unclassified Arthrobacter TaxID=235627 RepID=UPI0015E23D44|nr:MULTISPECIES: acyltransferase family protein [unclassified Arthrobacter]